MVRATEERNQHLNRRLGLFSATITGIGVIIGAGVYVIIGIAAGSSGNALWLSFLFAALGATLTGISYARMGKLRPKNAPEYHFLSMAFGRAVGFLAGWLVIWAIVISTSAVALGFAGYLEHITGIPLIAGALGLILLSTVVVLTGVRESVVFAGLLTVLGVSGLLLVIGIGIPALGDANLLEMPYGLSGVFTGASLVFFSYLGFEGMANLSEEMRDPKRDMPRAIILALVISSVLYIMVSVAAVSVVDWVSLSGSSAPLALVASEVLGSHADSFLAVVALASTANTVLLLLLASSRAAWGMSCARVLPAVFCRAGGRQGNPWLAVITVGGLTALFAMIRDIQSVAEFTNFAILLAFAGVNASAIKILGSQPSGGHRTRHILFNRLVPALGMIISLLLAADTGWRAALFGAALLGTGILLYAVFGIGRTGGED